MQNIISNDINKVNDSSSCFASLLTPQGKYLFDFIIVKHKNGYFIDCEKKNIEELFKQLTLYKLRSNALVDFVIEEENNEIKNFYFIIKDKFDVFGIKDDILTFLSALKLC